jgi:YVTN family beta-propeller protein
MSRHTALVVAVTLLGLSPVPLMGQDPPRYAGPIEKSFLLPNGWMISPVGKQVPLKDLLPLNVVPVAGGTYVLVATSGYHQHELLLIDLRDHTVADRQTVRESWFGLALAPRSDRLWWSGGGTGRLHSFDLKNGKLSPGLPLPNPSQMSTKEQEEFRKQDHFKSGLALDARSQTLYTLDINAGTISAISTPEGREVRTSPCGRRPYDVALARNGSRLYVSDWASRTVLALDPDDLRIVAKIGVGDHPNQIAAHPGDDRLFVACASSNCVSVIDTKRGVVTETIMTALFPMAPEGSTPDAVAVAPDGKTLYVANADNNCVAVIDISVPQKSQVKGFIPTGWYPTAVAVSPDNRTLFVGVGKGSQSKPLRKGAFDAGPFNVDASTARSLPYVSTNLTGALSIVPIPDDKQLAEYTSTVYRNCPYSDDLLSNAPYPHKTAIPTKLGEPSPIKHIIYVIKENRTYDQVFGDIKKGNGDPALLMFGEEITPNSHKLVNEFVLLDNLYCNAEVSRDGHPWSTMAYVTDYTARDWHLTYSGRRGVLDDDEGNLTKAPSGYLWDACARQGLSYRCYGIDGTGGEPAKTAKMEARTPSLVGHDCVEYTTDLQRQRDTEKLEIFLKEFRHFEEKDSLPRFMVMHLGEDHCEGTRPGRPTPQACVANNDLALGRLVEAVSKSKYWPQIAIFVIEDDAQDGPDHVDSHRTVGLVISPYVKRGSVDSTQYSTVSMIRTMELILGLPPLSQYDAAARPMFACFTDQPDLAPYQHEPTRIDVNAVNAKTAYGADRSSKMDFSDFDKIDDAELNEILWRSIKGKDAPLPSPVRRAMVDRPDAGEPARR